MLRLSSLTDATGKVTQFDYLGTDMKIDSITDHFGRAAHFAYDASGRLESITDAIGIVSSFAYDDATGFCHRIGAMTTPYGITTVTYEESPTVAHEAGWAVTITDPQGDARRIERFDATLDSLLYHDGATPFTLPVATAEPRPPNPIGNVEFLGTIPPTGNPNQVGTDHFHVTLEWDKQQWGKYLEASAANPSADRMAFAKYTLWLMRQPPGSDWRLSTEVPLATRLPGESAKWYNYPGQTAGYLTGTSAQHSKVARFVEDEAGVPPGL